MAPKIDHVDQAVLDKWIAGGVHVGLCCDPVDVKAAGEFGRDLMVWLGRKPGPVSVQPSPLAAWLAVCAIAGGKWDGADDRIFSIDSIDKQEVMEMVWPYLDGAFWANYVAWANCLKEIGVTGMPASLALLERAVQFGPVWPLEQHVVISDRPEQIIRQGIRLHREDGPAVRYRDGFSVWALNGVRVPAEIVMTRGEDMGVDFLRKYICGSGVNAEVRREVVRKVGVGLVIERLGGKVIDRSPDGVYELVLLNAGDDSRQRPYLKMKNPSIGIYHVEGVHPTCDTVEKALAWRNGLTEDKIDDENGADWIQQGDVLLFPAGAGKFKRHPKKLT